MKPTNTYTSESELNRIEYNRIDLNIIGSNRTEHWQHAFIVVYFILEDHVHCIRARNQHNFIFIFRNCVRLFYFYRSIHL